MITKHTEEYKKMLILKVKSFKSLVFYKSLRTERWSIYKKIYSRYLIGFIQFIYKLKFFHFLN